MNHEEFKKRLTLIIKIRKTLTRNDLVSLLNTFWQHSKPKLESIYLYYCYNILRNLLFKFDTIIEESNRRYYYIHATKLLTYIK